MKKSLFAIAAVTAFAGAAHAQSSVTVYGILDVGYTGGNIVNQPQGVAGVGNTAVNIGRIGNSMESGSRIGFRGNEDIGGGTSAQFVFELGMQPAGNAGSNPTGNNRGAGNAATGTYAGQGSAIWSPDVRQAYVGLTQKGAGTVRIGTQNTLFWEQGGSNTAGQLSQTAGGMLAPSTVGAFFDNSTTTQAAASIPSMASYASRTTNTINFRTERMGGFVGKASWTQSNQSTNLAASGFAGVSNQSGYQIAGDFTIQKANFQASYAAFTSDNPVAAGVVAAWGTGTQGTSARDNQLLVTASYDFGILKAFAGYTDRTLTATTVANDQLRRSAYEIGARSFITPKIEGWASAGMGTMNFQGVGGNTANLTGYQLGSNYWMSKRTNLYAIVGQNNQAGTNAAANVINSVNTDKQTITQYSLGVRHTF